MPAHQHLSIPCKPEVAADSVQTTVSAAECSTEHVAAHELRRTKEVAEIKRADAGRALLVRNAAEGVDWDGRHVLQGASLKACCTEVRHRATCQSGHTGLAALPYSKCVPRLAHSSTVADLGSCI